ncbi:PAS domain-containing protein, partial [Aeromonas veronii]
VIWINEAFSFLTGYGIEEMQGKKPGKLLQGPDTDPATVAIMRDALAQQNSFNVDVVNYSKAQNSYWVRIACNPLF